MRALLIFLTLCLAMLLGSASPIDPKRQLVNRPHPDVIDRNRRYAVHQYNINVKGKGPVKRLPSPMPELNLKKGEYIRDNKVHKLKPGEIPKNCPEGMCQYPV